MPAKKQIHTARHQLFRSLLIEARKANGLTQTDVANRLGKPPSFVAKYELGERRLDVLEFIDLAEVIGFDVTDMIRRVTGSSVD
jgi:transcriptional regulator with XRE-family HTH domain